MTGSPTTRIIEQDRSAYTVYDTGVGVAIMGYATKGVFNEEILIRSLKEFEDIFGKAPTSFTNTYFAVKKLLAVTNKLYFVRVGDKTTSETKTNLGSLVVDFTAAANNAFFIPAVAATQTITVTTAATNAGIITVAGIAVTVAALDTTAVVAEKVRVAIANVSTGLGATWTVPAAITGSGFVMTKTLAGLYVPAFTFVDTGTTLAVVNVATKTDGVNAVGAEQKITFFAKEGGTYAANLKLLKESVVQFDGTYVHNIYVSYFGEVKEIFRDVSFVSTDLNYFSTVINRVTDNGGSALISVGTLITETFNNSIVTGYTTEFAWGVGTVPATQEYTFLVGTATDGLPANVNDAQTYHIAALDAGVFANVESSDFHILIAPEASMLETVKDRCLVLCATRGEAIFLVDTPEAVDAITVTSVVNYHNGYGAVNGRTAAFNTSYGAMYWPWEKDYDTVAANYAYFPSSIFLAEKLVKNAQDYGMWFAPAGDKRGKLSVAGIRYSPDKSERDALYGETNAVNPIVNFNSKGITIYGQKTLQRETSARNRINVRMTLNEIKKRVKVKMDELLFEPNSPSIWAKAKASIDGILEPIRLSGGIDRYQVIIDASVNTPDVVQQNLMKGIVRIVPMNTIEEIEISMFVDPAGTTFTE
jgi:hypothetical protein